MADDWQPPDSCCGKGGETKAPEGLTFGDAGRKFMNNPSRLNFDVTVLKRFKISEGSDLEFRAETFNLLQPHPISYLRSRPR